MCLVPAGIAPLPAAHSPAPLSTRSPPTPPPPPRWATAPHRSSSWRARCWQRRSPSWSATCTPPPSSGESFEGAGPSFELAAGGAVGGWNFKAPPRTACLPAHTYCLPALPLSLPSSTCSGYVRALEDAVAIIDEAAFPIDTNDRAQASARAARGLLARPRRGAVVPAWHRRPFPASPKPLPPVPTAASNGSPPLLTSQSHPPNTQMMNIVNSCIGTKFTTRFGSLIAVSERQMGGVGLVGGGRAAACAAHSAGCAAPPRMPAAHACPRLSLLLASPRLPSPPPPPSSTRTWPWTRCRR